MKNKILFKHIWAEYKYKLSCSGMGFFEDVLFTALVVTFFSNLFTGIIVSIVGLILQVNYAIDITDGQLWVIMLSINAFILIMTLIFMVLIDLRDARYRIMNNKCGEIY